MNMLPCLPASPRRDILILLSVLNIYLQDDLAATSLVDILQ